MVMCQRRGDGGTGHDGEEADGENGIQQSLFHDKTVLNKVEIAALPSCEKTLFAGAKVKFFGIPKVTNERFFRIFAMESAMYKTHTKIHV